MTEVTPAVLDSTTTQLRIGLVAPYDLRVPGGVSAHVGELASELRRTGHATTVLAPVSGPEPPPSNDLIRFEGVVSVPTNGSVARLALAPRLGNGVSSVLRTHAFDVIHIHEPFTPGLPIAVLRASRTATVGTFHAMWESRAVARAAGLVFRRTFRRLHATTAVSEPVREFVSLHYGQIDGVVPNGVDVARFSTPASPIDWLRDGTPTVLFVGRPEPRKGLRYLLDAFALLRARGSTARLVVVGAMTERQRRACEHDVASRSLTGVHVVGWVPREDLPRYYQSCDVFCAPSIGSESQGVVILEAMASGTAIVASSIRGYQSVLTHERDAVLVPPCDSERLAVALERVLADHDVRRVLATAALRTAATYDWPLVARRVLTHYDMARRRFVARGATPSVQPPSTRAHHIVRLLLAATGGRPSDD